MKRLLSLMFVLTILACESVSAQDNKTQSYEIDRVVLTYARENTAYPELSELNWLVVPMKKYNGVFYSSKYEKGEDCSVNLKRFVPNSRFDVSAINEMLSAVVAELNKRGFDGVYVLPSQEQIDVRSGADKRVGFDKSLTFVIWVAEVSNVRTVAKGTRIEGEQETVDNSKHSRILANSPVAKKSESNVSTLDKDNVADYLRRLNRHPNRRVDSSVASSYNTGDIDIDYLVNERKPWIAYAQVSNTGTESTGDYRYRFGYVNYQATGNDDIFSIDYIDSFEDTRAGMASYQIPILFPDYLKFRVYGSLSDYTARDIGNTRMRYTGTNYIGGVEFISSPFSISSDFSLDFIAGARYENIDVNNESFGQSANDYMIIPYVGVALERRNPLASTYASVFAETNATDISESKMNIWGRMNSNDSYVTLKGDFIQSFYLEPLLKGDKFYDTSDWTNSIFANEIYFRARGQWTPDDKRLVAQQECIGGGLYSVRGYPESIAAGDNGFVLNIEYRLHFPRFLAPLSTYEDKTKTFDDFNLCAPNPLSFADWDLMMRVFFDYAQFYNNDRLSYEYDLELMSTGVGLECQIMSNLSARVDCGWILNGLEKYKLGPSYKDIGRGDYKINFVITLSF